MAKKAYVARSPLALSKTVIAFVWVLIITHIAFTLAYGLALLQQSGLGARFGLLAARKDLPDLIQTLIGVVSLITLALLLISGFISLKWIYRVNANARTLARGLPTTPAWAVGWFFVPIALLWKPYQAMKHAWQASIRPESWKTVPVPGSLGWWWGLWITSNIISNISGRLSDSTTEGVVSSILAGVAEIAQNLLFIQVVSGLTKSQVATMSSGTFD